LGTIAGFVLYGYFKVATVYLFTVLNQRGVVYMYVNYLFTVLNQRGVVYMYVNYLFNVLNQRGVVYMYVNYYLFRIVKKLKTPIIVLIAHTFSATNS